MSKHWLIQSVALLTFAGASGTLLSAEPSRTPSPGAPNYAAGQPPRTPLPGTVNYVEGQASINGIPLAVRQNGATEVQPNQDLTTANGKVEILLSPGVFLREGSNSEIRLISNGLADSTVEVVRGEALIEADPKPLAARVEVREGGATVSILQRGIYEFNADQNRIAVLDGRLRVTENEKTKDLGKGHEVMLNNPKLKSLSFDTNAAENKDDLYRWSSVRASYLAEANQAMANNIYLGYNPWWGPGWYWDPYFSAWGWMPGDGWFYGPFGYPYFAPGFGFYGGFYGGGYGFRGGYRGRFGYRGFAGSSFRGGGFAGGGVRGGGFGGGGFHGGGGRR